MDRVREEFSRFKGLVDATMTGGEPESVLVLELADRVNDLARAVEAVGLEWLGEWDIEIDADDDFPAGRQENNSEWPPVCFHGQRTGNGGTAIALG